MRAKIYRNRITNTKIDMLETKVTTTKSWLKKGKINNEFLQTMRQCNTWEQSILKVKHSQQYKVTDLRNQCYRHLKLQWPLRRKQKDDLNQSPYLNIAKTNDSQINLGTANQHTLF
jgi:hypothetical protein